MRVLLLAAAGLAVAALPGCAVLDRAGPSPAPVVDERAGLLGGVRFGDSGADVRERRGAPTDDTAGFFPRGVAFTGPPSVPSPPSDREPSRRPDELHYGRDAYLVWPSAGVVAMATAAEGARTRAGVGVGDDLDDVAGRYDGVRCGEVVAGESVRGDPPTYRWCRARVGAVEVFFGGDPIESVTLTRPAGRTG